MKSSAFPRSIIEEMIASKYSPLLTLVGPSVISSSIIYAYDLGNDLLTLDLVYFEQTSLQTFISLLRVIFNISSSNKPATFNLASFSFG